MSDFKAKMHQIRFPLGLCSRSYNAPTCPLAVFKGPTSKGRGREREGQGRKGKVKERKGKGGGWRDLANPKIWPFKALIRP